MRYALAVIGVAAFGLWLRWSVTAVMIAYSAGRKAERIRQRRP